MGNNTWDKVVLVNEEDEQLSEMDKLEAHQLGLLHRAFSVFIFNSQGEMLIHQRAFEKYHGGGLWTNACCSHPQWGEEVLFSAEARLKYEMGLSCTLEKMFTFLYHAKVEKGLIEHEFDHVLLGYTDEEPHIHKDEVASYKWLDPKEVYLRTQTHPEEFTYWFKEALPNVLNHLEIPFQ
mgnify:CR=1 FL=1